MSKQKLPKQIADLAAFSIKALQGRFEGENFLSVEGEVHGEEDEDQVLALQLSLQVKHPDRLAVAVDPDHVVEGEDVLGHGHPVVEGEQVKAGEVGHLLEMRHIARPSCSKV